MRPESPSEIEIAGRRVGPAHEPFVICELSGNHNGWLARALALIEAAAATGCDAVKIQTYTADTLTMDVDRPEFRIEGGLWDGRHLHDLYSEAQTPFEWHAAMFEHARRLGVTLFSTPFDESAVDLLEDLGTPAYKIASFEAVDLPLIRYAAAKGKPLIISTGMANLTEIEAAKNAAMDAGAAGVLLLHCVSSYPAPLEDANLLTVPDMAARFGCPVGLSDHTPGTAAAVAAVALAPARSRSTSPCRATRAGRTRPSAWSPPSSRRSSPTARPPGGRWGAPITTCWGASAATPPFAARSTWPATSPPARR